MARIKKKKLTPRVPRAELNRRAAREEVSNQKLAAAAASGPKYGIMDRSKPFQIVSPVTEGASYAQKCSDGITRYYDGTYRRVMTTFDVPIAPTKGGKGAAKPQPAPQPAPQAAEEGDDEEEDAEDAADAPEPAPPPAKAKPEAVDDGDVNLTGWAEDPDVNYTFGKIRATIQERYSKIVTTERDAIAFLVDEKVAEPDAAEAKWGV